MEREKHSEDTRASFCLWLPLLAAIAGAVVLLQTGCRSSHDAFSDVPGLYLDTTNRSANVRPGNPNNSTTPESQASNALTNSLLAGDVLSITFQYSTNFNVTQKIGLDGTLNLETVGLVRAAGKTPLQLQEDLARLYKSQVKDDVITVHVTSSVASIYVSGAVLRPGKVPLDRPLTAFEGIMEAGGFDATRAKLSDVTVFRLENGRQRVYHLDFRKVLQGKEAEPFYLRPFDIVQVPFKTFNF